MENYQSLDLTYIHKTLKDISNRDGSEFIPLVECCSSFQKINLTKSFNKREDEINKIKGLKTDEIEKLLGYFSKSEIVHRDDMVKL